MGSTDITDSALHDATPLFPPSPKDVPADLTAPSPSYRRSAWIATFGLLGFVAVYLGLTATFAWIVYRLFILHPSVQGFFYALPALFFLGFLVRGFFVVKHSNDPRSVELRPEDEPRLFAFLHRLADETGAPRPHRVFVSSRVNAAVFYDLSFRNLIFPSKKNLELGLGLVNALSIDELKAVLAHEFGHFAQRSMAVGRWVYVAQQIAGHVVMARTAFDKALQLLSTSDPRLAWIGWLMRIFVWAIRAVLDTCLRIVLLAERALGRQMELQADRVAVSVSGSDSLIHALHRLGPADEAWAEALMFAAEETDAGRPVADLFALQTAALVHLRRVLAQDDFGATPKRPVERAADHRVFEEKLASPPKMWATHPPNREREDHAKLAYIESALDERSSWELFADPERLRASVTRALLEPNAPNAKLKVGAPVVAPLPPAVPIGESLEKLDKRYLRASLATRYRGAYLGRPIAAYFAKPADMVETRPPRSSEAVLADIEAAYPESLSDTLAAYRERREEEQLLEGLEAGVLTAPGGIIRHRGREIRRKELRAVLETVRAERRDIERQLVEHDVACRSAHHEAASFLGQPWADYHASLVRLLHYATHGSRGIADAHSYLHHVLDIVLADGSVSSSERRRLLGDAAVLQDTLRFAWGAHRDVRLPDLVAERFGALGGYTVFKEPLGMNEPTDANLGDWLRVVDGWARNAAVDLKLLASATLDTLLDFEDYVAHCLRTGDDPGFAPAPAVVPANYGSCVVGSERERQKRLGLWDRFQTADGFFPGLARFVVAAGLLLPTLAFVGQAGRATVRAHNGFSRAVVVRIGEETQQIRPHETVDFEVEAPSDVHVSTTNERGEAIEDFRIRAENTFGTYVYNVANSASFVRWTAHYGGDPNASPNVVPVGAQRWFDGEADDVLAEPPRTVSTRGASTRSVLSALDAFDDEPVTARGLMRAATTDQALVLRASHLTHEPVGSDALEDWLFVAKLSPSLVPIVRRRAQSAPDDRALQTALLNASTPEERESLCAGHRARAEERPADATRKYLALRCIHEPAERDIAFLSAYLQWPENAHLAVAALPGLVLEGRFHEAMEAVGFAFGQLRNRDAREALAIEAMRVVRAARYAHATDVPADYAPPEDASAGYFDLVRAVEQGPTPDESPFVTAFRALRRGQLEQALQQAATLGNDGLILVAFAGASDAATDEMRERALAVDPANLSPTAIHALIALAIRQGADATPLVREAERMETVLLQPIVDALRVADRTESAARLQALADQYSLRRRGIVLTMGLVALGADAPSTWRTEVASLLFPTERPYFELIPGLRERSRADSAD